MEILKFTDFEPNELVGMYVLIDNNKIAIIQEVSKAYFKTNTNSFSLKNGKEFGDSIWDNTYAVLISKERAGELSALWDIKKRERNIRTKISEVLNQVPLAKLKEIIEIINTNN